MTRSTTVPGGLLRRARRQARLSQRQLADLAGVTKSAVARAESGPGNPSWATMQRLLTAAGCALEVVTDTAGGEAVVLADHPADGARDFGGRHYPAHIETVPNRPPPELTPIRWRGWDDCTVDPRPSHGRVPAVTFSRSLDPYVRPALNPATGDALEPGTILDVELRLRAERPPVSGTTQIPAGRPATSGPVDMEEFPAAESAGVRIGVHAVSTGTAPRVGVFALQGDVREHLRALAAAGCTAVPVRRPGELLDLQGLVLPGGESTTMIKLARTFELLDPLRELIAAGLPVYGSCAGMILLADRVDTQGDQLAETIGGLDVTVRRNAFGRQVDSFEEDVDVDGVAGGPVRAVFIRAPWVQQVGPAATPLGRTSRGHVVAVRQGQLLATSFHPEVTGDLRVHELFAAVVRGQA